MAKEQVIKMSKILNIVLIVIMIILTILNVVVQMLWMPEGKAVSSTVTNNMFIVYIVYIVTLSFIFLGSIYLYLKGKKFGVAGLGLLLFSAGITLVGMLMGIIPGILTWIFSGVSIYRLIKMQ